jgi:hypothetical protein
MRRVFLVIGTAVVILLWLAGARAQAGPIGWSLSGGPSGPNYNPNWVATVLESHNFGLNGRIDLYTAELMYGHSHPATGTSSASVELADVRLVSTAPHQDVLNFGGPSGNYALSLVLTDLASGASGSLTFSGNLSGSVGLDQVNLTNTFLGPTTQTLTLGGKRYTVTVGPLVLPGPLTLPQGDREYISGQDGSISVHVGVATPEPSTLMVACLGLPSLGLAGWFRHRKIVDRNA